MKCYSAIKRKNIENQNNWHVYNMDRVFNLYDVLKKPGMKDLTYMKYKLCYDDKM
jgi:hypothetical protein